MRREELVDLNAFATVAEEQNFTRAAAKLGTSQSALSHTINRLLALVSEGRIACDHEAAFDAGEIGDEIVRNAVSEIVLARVAGEIGERQPR